MLLGNIEVKKGEKLAKYSWYGIGGEAEFFFQADNIDALQNAINSAYSNNVSIFILGAGSNTIFHDDGLKGLVIKMNNTAISCEGRCIIAGAGATMLDILKTCKENNLGGLEAHFGLPGTIGGAVFGNAGAHGVEIGSFVSEVKVISSNGELKNIKKNDITFEYRRSSFSQMDVTICEVTLGGFVNGYDEAKALSSIEFRKEKQPFGKNNGSFFKNPAGDYAGRLIEQAGLKGYKIGGAYISEQHANFFMNDGTARASDILALRDHVIAEVQRKFGIGLQPEVRIISSNGALI